MTCTEKQSFHTLRAAAEAVIEQFEKHGRSQRIYRCGCGAFHLTSKCSELTYEQLAQLQEVAR